MSGYVPKPYVPQSYTPQAYVPGGGQSSAAPAVPQQPSSSYQSQQSTPSTATYQPTTTSSYQPSTSYQPSSYQPTSYQPQPQAANPSGGFSQALSSPPPPQQQTPQAIPVYPSGTAAPVPTTRQTAYNPTTTQAYKPDPSIGKVGQPSPFASGPSSGLVTNHGNPQICHKIDYEIKGYEMQLVEIELDPSEIVVAEAGAMMFMENGIDFKTKFGDGSEPKQGFFKKILSAGGRLLTGESLFLTHFSNQGQGKARVAFAAPHPGNIVPLDLQQFGGKLICQKDAFLCASFGTKLALHFNRKIGSGFFGGEGFILQKLSGDGLAFIHAGGTIIQRELRGEKLRVDTGCLVAFTEGINFDIQLAPGLKTIIFGGEGIFLATLEGTGTVWMQSLPFSRMADQIVKHAPSIGGQRQGESDLVGSLFNAAF